MNEKKALLGFSGFAVLAILVLEVIAMSKGINGTGLAAAIGGISAIGGYVARALYEKIKKGI